MTTGSTPATRSRSRRTERSRPSLARFEDVALRGTQRHWGCLPGALAGPLRPRTARIADAFATSLGASAALRTNRVVGLGHRGRASRDAVDELVAFFHAARCRAYSVEVAPGPQRAALGRWLRERGFRREGGYAMLARDLRRPPGRPAGPWRIRRAGPADMPVVARLFGSVFPVARRLRPWSLAGARVQGEHYLARPLLPGRVGAAPVAVGTLIVDGRLGWLRGGATLTAWRRRGGQTALIAVRLRRAARLGCRWAWSETGLSHRGRPDASRRNLLRMGFVELGRKAVFVRRDG